MIVHIEELLCFVKDVNPSSMPDDMIADADEFYAVKELCDSFSVHTMLDLREDITLFSIYPQKITLDEFNMNSIFINVLNVYLDIEIRYMFLGGTGCNMSLAVTNKKTV